jgi:hypothetical protein
MMTRSLKRYDWKNQANLKHLFALASGALTFFILFAPLQEFDKTRPDNTTGMTLVGLASIIGPNWLHRRIERTIFRHANYALDY